MKKVRFVSPVRPTRIFTMHDSECHSPRPFIEKQLKAAPHVEYLDYRQVPFTNDPVQRFESGNSSPYPVINRTRFTNSSEIDSRWKPSNELDLSLLDSTPKVPVNICSQQCIKQTVNIQPLKDRLKNSPLSDKNSANITSSTENRKVYDTASPLLKTSDNFFLRRDNLQLGNDLNNLHLGKENAPILKKQEMMMVGPINNHMENFDTAISSRASNNMDSCYNCHHCIKICKPQQRTRTLKPAMLKRNMCSNNYNVSHCIQMSPKPSYCHCNPQPIESCVPNCNCSTTQANPLPQNVVDKKTWAIERYKLNKNSDLELEKQSNITIDARDPTVADLFKIIKMQSEQLQLLQEKVDKFISVNKNDKQRSPSPIHNYMTEQVALKSVESEQKISIGVMTSFEVVRTSTIINKEFVKQSEAQIQCNRSQISIKEVVSKQPVNLNFLDGLTPKTMQSDSCEPSKNLNFTKKLDTAKTVDCLEDKTFNEMSLYNVQVDNATPNISPEQSLYLDIRDYSDSDASSDDQSNVGWTYYNKVMTHVNGMLQESDMPSSASALYRDVRKKCLQMQVDKSNVSVAKRVTFGDDPLGSQKPQLTPTTDTSLKMNQLAAKYLKNTPLGTHIPSPRPAVMPVDMSMATRNYMEQHRILKGANNLDAAQVNIPKFLDITALKQQPKLL